MNKAPEGMTICSDDGEGRKSVFQGHHFQGHDEDLIVIAGDWWKPEDDSEPWNAPWTSQSVKNHGHPARAKHAYWTSYSFVVIHDRIESRRGVVNGKSIVCNGRRKEQAAWIRSDRSSNDMSDLRNGSEQLWTTSLVPSRIQCKRQQNSPLSLRSQRGSKAGFSSKASSGLRQGGVK